MNNFNTYYMGKFHLTDSRLTDLAEEYHFLTEQFDRTVCTGPIKDGAIMPANGTELGIINRNAKKIFREISSKAMSIGFSLKELQNEISRHK